MTLKKRVTRMRAKAISLVQRGAEKNSEFLLVQTADPALQGAVSDELSEDRAEEGGWTIWCAFQEVLQDARNPQEISDAIDELRDLLRAELLTPVAVGGVTEGDTMPQPEENAIPDESTPTIGQEMAETVEVGEPHSLTPATLTQSDVETMIEASLLPLRSQLMSTEASLATATALIEQQKTEIAVLQSKTAPASRQPDGAPSDPIVQAERPPWAGSDLDTFLTTHFRRS